MKYYISEKRIKGDDSRTARGKAREDVEAIANACGYEPVVFDAPSLSGCSKIRKILWQFLIMKHWRRAFAGLSTGDSLFVQFPFMDHSVFLPSLFKSARKRGVKTILLVHDYEKLRHLKDSSTSFFNRVKSRFETKTLKYAGVVIAHNPVMADVISDNGIARERIVELGIFDYLCGHQEVDLSSVSGRGHDFPVVIAGNLTEVKSGYVYRLSSVRGINFNLYGIGYTESSNDQISYKGSFEPDVLPSVIEGSFGLVWDGPSVSSCEGPYGEYLKYNDPHKVSLYLASGLPVIIWDQAALAPFIVNNGLGVAVSSLEDLGEVLAGINEEDYALYLKNVGLIACRLKAGEFLKTALELGEQTAI